MSVPSWAVPGARVVCVDVSPKPCGASRCLVEGRIYTIALVEGKFLRLVEPETQVGEYATHWYVARFRPLVDTTTADEVERRLFRKKRLHQPVSARLTA